MNYIEKILAFFIITLIGLLIWLFYGYFVSSDANVKASLIGLGTVIVAAIITHTYSKKREIQARHFSEKSKAYEPIFNLIFDSIRMTKEGKEFTEDQMISKSLEIKKSLMIWGGQDVLQAWIKYEKEANNKHKTAIQNIDKVIRKIRKDIGHDDSLLKSGELLKLLVVSDDWDKLPQGDENDK